MKDETKIVSAECESCGLAGLFTLKPGQATIQCEGGCETIESSADDGDNFTVSVPYTFTVAQVANIFCSAFEGGYSPWIHGVNLRFSDHKPKPGLVFWGTDEVFAGEWTFELTYTKEDEDEDQATGSFLVTPSKVKNAFPIFARVAPQAFSNLVRDDACNFDALDADAFVQCLVFGKLVYG